MTLLFTADLHLDIPARSPRTGATALDAFAEQVRRWQPDGVVVVGDIGNALRAGEHLLAIRRVAGDRMLAVCLGNHDFWLEPSEHHRFERLSDLVTEYWAEPAREVDALLLDVENASFGGIVVCGGYGHFDLGLAEPDLQIFGHSVTEEVYLSGGIGRLYWNDFAYIPNCATRLKADAREQADTLSLRLDEAVAAGRRVLAVTHTCPWRELNGHPPRGNEYDILSAYSGNSLMGSVLESRANSIELAVCGHTHFPVRERSMHGIRALNVGADYGRFRGILYDTNSRSIAWLGEPF